MSTDIRSDDLTKELVTSAHFNLAKVQEILEKYPDMLEVAFPWRENDPETPIQAAAHMGNVPIAEYLLSKGAPLAIYTAAMLGRTADVKRLLNEDPANAKLDGAHGIPLMSHVALSGNTEIAELVLAAGANTGLSFALHAAVSREHINMVKWLLEHGAIDFTVKDFQGNTPLAYAVEHGLDEIAQLLRDAGAVE